MNKKVLVVDDESSIRKLLSVALGNRGFEVLEAEDGLAALVHAAQHAVCHLGRDRVADALGEKSAVPV